MLMLINNLAGPGGGAERFVVALARELARDGLQVEVCATRGAKPSVQDALAALFTWTRTDIGVAR